MQERKILVADDGKILTDGNIYGKVVFLSVDADISKFTEITKEEYDAVNHETEEIT